MPLAKAGCNYRQRNGYPNVSTLEESPQVVKENLDGGATGG